MSESETERCPEETNSKEVLHPKRRSLVWRFFEKTSRYRVRCNLCKHEQNYQGTTGNIMRHLKSKHDLDMTIKGQQDPQNQKRIKELCGVTVPVSSGEVKQERNSYVLPRFKITRRKSLEDESDIDPYEEDNDTIQPLETYITSEDPFHINENSKSSNEEEKLRSSKRKNKSDLEDERVKAETEYFQEKAGYYRLMKHLTALQAKKVKIEIEQLTANSNT